MQYAPVVEELFSIRIHQCTDQDDKWQFGIR